MSTQLLPCPFCGVTPELLDTDHPMVVCQTEECCLYREALNAVLWNRRPSPVESPAPQERKGYVGKNFQNLPWPKIIELMGRLTRIDRERGEVHFLWRNRYMIAGDNGGEINLMETVRATPDSIPIPDACDPVEIAEALNKALLREREAPVESPAPLELEAGKIIREFIQQHKHNTGGAYWDELSPGQQESWRRVAEQVVRRFRSIPEPSRQDTEGGAA